MAITDSILDSTKKILGIESDYNAFDTDIITHINSVFFTLNQLGIGPAEGFSIDDSTTTWGDYIGVDQIHAVRSYMALKVRLLFDPPTTSFTITSFQEQIKEWEWRLNTHREEVKWLESTPET